MKYRTLVVIQKKIDFMPMPEATYPQIQWALKILERMNNALDELRDLGLDYFAEELAESYNSTAACEYGGAYDVTLYLNHVDRRRVLLDAYELACAKEDDDAINSIISLLGE